MSRFEIAIVVLLLAVWMPGLAVLADFYGEVDYASHGFLVPWVALWAATAHRASLQALPPRPVRGGLVLLGGVLLAYIASLLIGDPTLIGLVWLATVTAAVAALRGIDWLRALRFPLGYLVFMVPLPSAWVTPLIVQLQLAVSNVAVAILRAAGLAIHREGNVLTLPGDVSLFVAEACSGITSLITLIPIGVFIAYFTESSNLRRCVLVATVVPIALAGNLLRVLLTVLLSIEMSVEFATTGPLHDWAGVATYVIGCLCLLGVGAAMRRLWPDADGLQANG